MARFFLTLVLALNAFSFFVPIASPPWWILTILPCWFICGMLYRHARTCEARMPHEYLRRMGSLLVSLFLFTSLL